MALSHTARLADAAAKPAARCAEAATSLPRTEPDLRREGALPLHSAGFRQRRARQPAVSGFGPESRAVAAAGDAPGALRVGLRRLLGYAFATLPTHPSAAFQAGSAAFRAGAPRWAPPFERRGDRAEFLRGYDAANEFDAAMW